MKFSLFFLILIIIYLIWYIVPTYVNKFCQLIRKHKNSKSKNIYLTFDDGPSEFTDELLDVLKKNKIHATFFMVVSFALEHPDIIKKIKDQGHQIGFHSYHHSNGLLMSIKKEKEDFEKCLKTLEKLHINTIYYRPPWGHINIAMLFMIKKYNLKMAMWDVMAEDWEGNTTSDIIYKKIIKRVKNGNIICLHDGRGKKHAPKRTIEALKRAIPELIKKGFNFKTIDEYEK